MSTVTPVASAQPMQRILYPHAQWYFLFAIAITWLGFSRTYFAVLPTEPLLHHVHGALMGAWILVLIVQPILYQRGYLKLHRALGKWSGYCLMPAITACGYLMIRQMLRTQDVPPDIIDQLAFLDMTTLILFPMFVLLSIRNARRLQLHARYMVCTVLLLLPPALTRAFFFLPHMNSFNVNVNASEALVIGVLLILIVDDKRQHGFYLPYPMAATIFTFLAVASNFAYSWSWWRSLARQIV
jgi:hypothetical protein